MNPNNVTFLKGNLVDEPTLRYIPAGTAICEFRLASNNPTNKEAKPFFILVKVWAKQAEACAEHLHKGSPVQLWGELNLETWDDKETKQKRSKVTVTALSVQFLSSGKGKPETTQGDDFSHPADNDEVPF